VAISAGLSSGVTASTGITCCCRRIASILFSARSVDFTAVCARRRQELIVWTSLSSSTRSRFFFIHQQTRRLAELPTCSFRAVSFGAQLTGKNFKITPSGPCRSSATTWLFEKLNHKEPSYPGHPKKGSSGGVVLLCRVHERQNMTTRRSQCQLKIIRRRNN